MKRPRRRTVARHGQLHRPSAGGQLLRALGIVLAVVLVSGVGVAAYIGTTLLGTVSANSVEIEGAESVPPDIAEYEGGFNMLLVGVDVCEDEYAHLFPGRCSGKGEDGTLNDTNLIVHVSDEPRRATVVSVPRDTMLAIPSCTDDQGNTSPAMEKQPLNDAWGYGGLNCVVQTLELLTGFEIQYAASVTWGGVIAITDAIGGVEVCLATPIKDEHTLLDLPAGTRTIQGYEALQFLRTRHGVGDGSDIGRIGNQQQYMSSLARKMLSGEVLGNVGTMLKLANTAVENLTTSTTLTPMTIAQIGLALKDVPKSDIVFVQYPTWPDPDNPKVKLVPNRDAADALMAAIESNQPLQITHENGDAEGVIVETPVTPAPVASGTPAPTDTAVALPEEVMGNSADQQTCSNGKDRG